MPVNSNRRGGFLRLAADKVGKKPQCH
jgi:hypothetical protein